MGWSNWGDCQKPWTPLLQSVWLGSKLRSLGWHDTKWYDTQHTAVVSQILASSGCCSCGANSPRKMNCNSERLRWNPVANSENYCKSPSNALWTATSSLQQKNETRMVHGGFTVPCAPLNIFTFFFPWSTGTLHFLLDLNTLWQFRHAAHSYSSHVGVAMFCHRFFLHESF